MSHDFTLVVGVDSRHLEQLVMVLPTWLKTKPVLSKMPMLVFFDREECSYAEVDKVVTHPNATIVPWPPDGVTHEGIPGDRWTDPQRYKMLSGFVYRAANYVETPYWLKLDTDVIGIESDKPFPEPDWFEDTPAIASHRWSYTKPANQMMMLDRWVEDYRMLLTELASKAPLNLIPKPDSSRVGHRRIISWCAFFNTKFTQSCADWAASTCGYGRLPVPSQDGFMFYCAKRLGLPIRRLNMKDRGWRHCSTTKSVAKHLLQAAGYSYEF